MKFSKYITSTWLLANLLHPFAYRTYFALPLGWDFIKAIPRFWFWGSFLSLPGYLLSCLIFLIVRRLFIPTIIKLFALVIGALAGIMISVWLLSFVISARDHFAFLLELSVPAMISAVLSALIRYKTFIQSMNPETYEIYLFP